jgi:K(+)-stimulated pyrophosphate-energized sodium pump
LTSTEDMTIVLETLAGFSLGAESIAFARVGGGIIQSGRCWSGFSG